MKQPQCCPKGSLGKSDSDFELKGNILSIDNMQIYNTGKGKNILIVAHDIFGFHPNQVKAVCDQFADFGLNVYLLDFFDGEGFEVDRISKEPENFVKFLNKYGLKEIHQKVFDIFIPYLKKQNIEYDTLGIAGFCWGAVVTYLCSQNSYFNYGVSLHPSLNIVKYFQLTPIEFGKKVECPQLLILSIQEDKYYRQNGDLNNHLKQKFGNDFEFYEYQQQHGFVCRGNLEDQNVKKDFEDCMLKVKSFIKKFIN